MIYWILIGFAILTATFGIFLNEKNRSEAALSSSFFATIILGIIGYSFINTPESVHFEYTQWILLIYGMITAIISFLSPNPDSRSKSGWVAFFCAVLFGVILFL